MSAPAEVAFGDACHFHTGGNPFLVIELLQALVLHGVRPIAEDVAELEQLSSAEVARSVLERVASIGPAALALLEAVAVLGGRADLRLSAALAVVNGDEAGPIADALAAVGLLRPGRPLDFVHRFVGASVYAEIPPARRSTAHAEAAQLLAALRPDGPAAAVHLLETEPRGKAWVVSSLLKAARIAIDRDDLVAARSFVARALAEPPAADQQAPVLHLLAEVQGRLGCPDAVDHFCDAGRLGVDINDWAAVGIMLAERFWGTPHAITVIDELQAAKDRFGARQPDLLARLELLVSAMPSALHRTERVDARVAAVAATVLAADEATRRLATAYVAAAGAADAATADISEIMDVIRTTVTSEDAAAARGALAVNVMTQVLGVLVAAGRADLAEPLLRTAKQAADARGDSSASAAFAIVLARSLATTGPLHAAEELVLEALNGTDDNTLREQALLAWTQILASRGDLLGAAGALAGVDVAGWTGTGLFDTTAAFETRGYLNLLGHRWSLALDDFEFTGAIAEKQGIRNPALASWRMGASHALIELGRLDRATALSAENLELARRFGAPVPIAEALRCSARMATGRSRLTRLEEAVEILEHTSADLERCRALIDLGRAQRESGDCVGARRLLRQGGDLAVRLGAAPLAGLASCELRAAGARPRRLHLSGTDALTPAEHRVVTLAARGCTNASIAASLFVSLKTVESHLSRSYRKLGAKSRAELADLIDLDAEPG